MKLRNIKYLGKISNKRYTYLYTENYKTLFRENIEDLNK